MSQPPLNRTSGGSSNIQTEKRALRLIVSHPYFNVELHVGVKLLLAVLCAVRLALEGAQTLEALAWLAYKDLSFAQELDQARFLDLLLETLLKAVIALFAVFVGMDCHRVRGS